MDQKSLPLNVTCGARIAVGLLTATCLHFALYFAGSLATGIWEREHGVPTVYGDSPLLSLLCGGVLLAVLWWGRPRLLDWALPFTLWLAFWFMEMASTNFHPDTAQEAEVAAFSLVMFLACLCIWSLALLLALVRWGFRRVGVTKESHNQ